MSHQHASLGAGRWQTLSLTEQLANVGSDVARARRWQEKDPQQCDNAFVRALELLDMTISDPRWKGRRKELTRVREFLCDAMLGALGLVAGLWSEKFDQMAAFQSFVIMPMTFLSGVFYSIHSLPVFWQKLSHLNPFFYMIDGFRYGFFGQSDVSPWVSLTVVSVAFLGVSTLAIQLLKSGYKIRG